MTSVELPSTSAGISSSFFERTISQVMRYARPSTFDGGVGKSSGAFRFAPNLARETVAFDGTLKDPLPLRAAMLCLHDIVTGDERFKKRGDPERYQAYLQSIKDEEDLARRGASAMAKMREQARIEPMPAGFDKEAKRAVKHYWKMRHGFMSDLLRSDPGLWRALMPSDPLVTVAPDVVMFEGLSKDTSSWGLVLVDRDAFVGGQDATLGSTNVDYSPTLFTAMLALRSYKPTRFGVDPQGLDVSVGETAMREDKIDVPAPWLKAFGQIASCMFLADKQVRLPADMLANVLMVLKRKREKAGPRALRFELTPGKPPRIVLEPWGIVVDGDANNRACLYQGPRPESIKVWGRRRLTTLAGAVERVQSCGGGLIDVQLLGSGMPSLWTANVGGGVRLVLGLSGWTMNDWSGSARLDLLAAGATASATLVERCGKIVQQTRASSINDLVTATRESSDKVRAAVVELARLGQVVGDPTSGSIRFRSVIEGTLSAELLGDDPPELREGRKLFASRATTISGDQALSVGGSSKRALVATVGNITCEGVLDADGQLTRARCSCSHFHRFGIRKGPCRHLLALRLTAMASVN